MKRSKRDLMCKKGYFFKKRHDFERKKVGKREVKKKRCDDKSLSS
jgi:hypothetical protein